MALRIVKDLLEGIMEDMSDERLECFLDYLEYLRPDDLLEGLNDSEKREVARILMIAYLKENPRSELFGDIDSFLGKVVDYLRPEDVRELRIECYDINERAVIPETCTLC